jgi:hypothetical protein
MSRASPGESHWKAIGKPLDPAWLKWSHVIAGELLRIHWEGPKAIAGAHSKTIHDGSLEGRHQQVGWFVPQPGGVAKHHFHWEKMGHIYGISSFQKWLYDSWYVLNG